MNQLKYIASTLVQKLSRSVLIDNNLKIFVSIIICIIDVVQIQVKKPTKQ